MVINNEVVVHTVVSEVVMLTAITEDIGENTQTWKMLCPGASKAAAA